LEKIGTTRRDAAGTLISSGEDLNQPGITEWCFDIVYVTCKNIHWYIKTLIPIIHAIGACQVGSGVFGEWFWYFWLVVSSVIIILHLRDNSLYQIPLYAGVKIWNNFISPMVLGRSSSATLADDPNEKETLSKRQEKLRKRNERGDPRVKAGKR
jgi:hypothetical protein